MSLTRLDPRQALPLWAQLSSLLRERAAGGAYSERFPTEADLTAEFEVSRATVREAIRRLREEGLLDARSRQRDLRVRRPAGRAIIGAPGLARAIVAAGLEEEATSSRPPSCRRPPRWPRRSVWRQASRSCGRSASG